MKRSFERSSQRGFFSAVFLIVGISILVLYLASDSVSGQAVRRTPSLFAAPSASSPTPLLLASNVDLQLVGLDNYHFSFTNRQGTRYSFGYLTSWRGKFKYGDSNLDDLIFIEAPSSSQGNIGLLDQFVLSNQRNPLDTQAVSHIVQYTAFDPSNDLLSFYEQGGGTRSFTYQRLNPLNPVPGVARLIFGGNTYTAYVLDMQGTLAVDMNSDGAIQGTKVNLVAYESIGSLFTPVVIDLGDTTYNGNGQQIPVGTPITLALYQGGSSVITDKLTITAAQVPTTNYLVLQVLQATGPH